MRRPVNVLLVADVFIDSNEDIVIPFRQGQQFAIFFAAEACFSHGGAEMAWLGEEGLQFAGQTLVQQ
jgi:hypothetical protein